MNIDHRIIISIHVPVKDLSNQKAHERVEEVHRYLIDTFPKDYIVLFFADLDSTGKISIECINTENIHNELEDIEKLHIKFEEMKNYSISKKVITKFKL